MDAQALKREIYENYMDDTGLVTIAHQKLCRKDDMERGMGNGLLHTGLFFTVLAELGALTQVDIDNFNYALEKVVVKHQGYVFRGLVHRHLRKIIDQEKQDDYYSLISASYHAGTGFAKDCLHHGSSHSWHWNNLDPLSKDPELYFDRFPGFVPYVRMGARETLGMYEALPLIGSILAAAFSSEGNSDSRIHRWCQLTVLRKELGSVGQLTSDLFSWRIRKRFGSIPRSWEGYLGPTYVGSKIIPHPLTLAENIR